MEAAQSSNPVFFRLYGYLFFGYGILFLPFPFHLLNIPYHLSHFFFQDLLHLVGGTSGVISSDSPAMYLLFGLLAFLALLTTLLLTKFNQWPSLLLQILHSILCYYLALQLMKYGFDKLFKAQFYLPEPNTLYTPLGKISKDLLFWSSMGTSYAYNVFMGLLEIIPAILILFRKSRSIGLLIACGVLTNIVAINFSFDISVKLYASFLLALSIFLLFPQFQILVDFFFRQKLAQLGHKPSWLLLTPFWKKSIRFFIWSILFFEALFPHFQKGYWNDDLAPRPFLHGAYEVQDIRPNYDLKRIFVHRNGYIIFQNQADEMQDFHLTIDSINQQLLLTDYQAQNRIIKYQYQEADSLLFLEFTEWKQDFQLRAKALDWRNLPAINHSPY